METSHPEGFEKDIFSMFRSKTQQQQKEAERERDDISGQGRIG